MAIINNMPLTTTTKMLAEIIETPTTTATPFITTTDFPLYADFIAAPASSMSSAAAEDLMEQAHNQITFEIPSEHDLKHIDALHTFNTLLKRIGNMAYDTMAMNRDLNQQQQHQQPIHLSADQTITTEQIAKSVVLDLAEVNENHSSAEQFMERMLADTDINAVINYLWIGVVTALVVLSVIFIVFSCYFYRKFREWKKCNKDIRSQMTGSDLYSASSISARARTCDQRLLNVRGQANCGTGGDGGSTESTEAAFYQIETPPCYTIATGLPTYDEALHHQNQHYTFGMKCIYSSLAAVHHQQQQQHSIVSNWEKDELTLEQRKAAKQVQSVESQNHSKFTMNVAMEDDTPPAYADAAAATAAAAVTSASVALLSDDVTKLQDICINIEDMTTTTQAATAAATTKTSPETREIPAVATRKSSSKSLQDNHVADNDDSCSIVVIAA